MKLYKSYLYILLSYLVALFIGYISYEMLINHYNLLLSTLIADIICTIVIFLFSVIVHNSSVYDPYWSVIPPFIFLLWLFEMNFFVSSLFILLMFLIWSTRLTYNWAINWRGLKHEDWRYVSFRNNFKKLYWIISLLGIHLFPTLIVFLGMLPIYMGLKNGHILYVWLFIFGFTISLIGVVISYLADIHLTKHRHSLEKEQAIQIGIWKYSRHPNYLGEITFWLGCFVVGISSGFQNYYTIIGFIAMGALFSFFSIPVMEKRLLKTKVNYQDIIKTVPKLFPFQINLINRKKIIEK